MPTSLVPITTNSMTAATGYAGAVAARPRMAERRCRRVSRQGASDAALPGAESSGRLPILRDGALVLHGTEAILRPSWPSHDSTGKWLPIQGIDFAR